MLKATLTQRPLRRIVPVIIVVVGLILISALVIQQVSAQTSRTLKPPFKLIPAAAGGPHISLPPLPANATVVISETFGDGFVANPALTGNGWHTVNFSGTLQGYSWGRVSNSGLMTDTAWIAQERYPSSLPEILPGQPYTTNMNAMLIYGPLDLSDYGAVVVSTTYFLDVNTGDAYGLAYSLDGTNFIAMSNEAGRDPTLSNQRTTSYNLPGAARQSTVWLAFYFNSTDHPIDALGVFLDNVVVYGVPLSKAYMPIVLNVYPPPTATPTATPTPTASPTPQVNYLHNYTFGAGLNTDPQFLEWGGKVVDANCVTSDPGGCTWGQDVVTSGNPDGALNMYQTGLNAYAAASPNNYAPTNFELSADFYVIQGKSDARLGLVFDTSDSAFDWSRSNYFDPYRNQYKFDLQFNESNNTIMSYYRLQKYVTTAGAYQDIVAKSTLPGGLVGNVGTWNNITIQRVDTNIKVYVNGALLININDGTYIGSKKYGFFLQTKLLNSSSNPLKVRFDNVRVRTLP